MDMNTIVKSNLNNKTKIMIMIFALAGIALLLGNSSHLFSAQAVGNPQSTISTVSHTTSTSYSAAQLKRSTTTKRTTTTTTKTTTSTSTVASTTTIPVSGTTWINGYSQSLSGYSAVPEVVRATSDSGYIIGGISYGSTGAANATITKINSQGAIQWQKIYSLPGPASAAPSATIHSIRQTSDGGYIIAGAVNYGQYNSSNPCYYGTAGCALVIKLSSNGTLQWQKIYPGLAVQEGYGGAGAYDIQQTSTGNYIVVGPDSPTGDPVYGWVAGLNASGNLQWQENIGTNSTVVAVPYSITPSNGNYVIVGTFNSSPGQSAFAVKINPQGGIIWQKTYGTDYFVNAYSVQQTSDGGDILAGTDTYPKTTQYDGNAAILAIKINSNGNIQWEKSYTVGYLDCLDEDGNTAALSVSQTSDNGYVFGGSTSYCKDEETSASLPYLLKTNSTGVIEWQHVYGISSGASGSFISTGVTKNNTIIAAGIIATKLLSGQSKTNIAESIYLVSANSNGIVASCSDIGNFANGTYNPGISPVSVNLTATTGALPTNSIHTGSLLPPGTYKNNNLEISKIC
jgi:hypothetical protein